MSSHTEPNEAVQPWGRVDDDGTVYVREGAEWREVGQYPDASADEALAYFARKFSDLADKVTLLEQRSKRGGATASELAPTVRQLRADVVGAAAVGDLAKLDARLEVLADSLKEATALEAAASREAVVDAAREREAIVEAVEALAAQDPQKTQWKTTTQQLNDAFAKWQDHQQNGPRLPKADAQALWKRFRNARTTIERHRREYFAELDDTHRAARDAKTRLVERAEALAPKGEDGITAYRGLLDEWKASGRAGKRVDDTLWARFKAAGDALYGARAERDAEEAADSLPKIEAKKALLEQAKAVADEADLAKARTLLTQIQREWDEIGRIFGRDQERSLDDGMRRIEQALRGREDADWKANDPRTKARANDMTQQLEDAITKLEAELEAAKAAGNASAAKKLEESLAARKAWLGALGA